ncbi:MAG: hypothetical protein FJX94_00325 [Bacteroidetes bacterium]|nr:hypothetical protein [Bacteroidota bacterium]
MQRTLFIILVICVCAACEQVPNPRPKGYFKIDFPEHAYRVFDSIGYPYQFEYPQYARVVKDSVFFDDAPENPYWINVDFPDYNARLHISYKQIGTKQQLSSLVDDAFKLTSKHTLKASSIEEEPVRLSPDVQGFVFHVGGNAATGKQFFLTDSVKHFMRGALYFDAAPNADSLLPVSEFLYRDIEHLMKTLRWKNK